MVLDFHEEKRNLSRQTDHSADIEEKARPGI